MKRFLLALSTVALLVVLAGGALAAPASAETGVFRGTDIIPLADSGVSNDCLPGVTGTLVGTLVVDYQNNNMTEGFHTIHTETATVRIEWSDGTYTDVEWVDHISFNTGSDTEVSTVAHQESGNRYTTDGVFLSQSTIHLIEHTTVTDGVVRVESVKVRVGC